MSRLWDRFSIIQLAVANGKKSSNTSAFARNAVINASFVTVLL
ncbi:hypothetical protein F441_00954 [Phytophthora nicotianae CJ01A1]|uniref:Uncharacterized protein n=3 Tax=Phytophthora nicotianae TaxID=4792 RepID=V9FY72_PHYNI|nr:hypothetical protein F443_00979 [Phytophthora nicotianae P1569]ETO85243.1 hypothetical protein F444_00987 [Phytophthora nicotianae P1976]ETP26272.1 hypothetical protein F441_00954 [Phytophthora nicotianae CJ01A1]